MFELWHQDFNKDKSIQINLLMKDRVIQNDLTFIKANFLQMIKEHKNK